MNAVFVGRGIGHDRRVPQLNGQPFLPGKTEMVRLNGQLYVCEDIHYDYDAMEIRVYLRAF